MDLAADEQLLVKCLGEWLAPVGFQQLSLGPVLGVRVLGAWKRSGWISHDGVAVLALDKFRNSPGEFAQFLKLEVGKAIGYMPLFRPLRLQLVVTGREMIERVGELQFHADSLLRPLRVGLQGIHVIDLAAQRYVARLPPREEAYEEEVLSPGQVAGIELYRARRFGLGGGPPVNPMKIRFDYSTVTGRVVRSIRHFSQGGWLSQAIASVDTLEGAISRFIHTPVEPPGEPAAPAPPSTGMPRDPDSKE
jgi:hypothetical protein